MTSVLAVDVGTTQMKVAIVEDGRNQLRAASISYPMNIREGNQRDIDTDHWWNAFLSCCQQLKPAIANVQAISFSVSTPGTTAIDKEGNALTPAVLFLDGRSGTEAQQIRDVIGEAKLLEITSNLPVSGGSTASTLLWWKKYQPDLFQKAVMFGHTNTLFVKRLTGNWGMDPSTASLSAMYNTTQNNGEWNQAITETLGIPVEKLPPIIPSWQSAGELLPHIADQIGLPAGIPVLMGGNDAMCAALTGGVTHEGAILNICGTCEILCIGLESSLPDANYNVRCHVIPKVWSTLYVLNTGGKALEWFFQNFCQEMDEDTFYKEYIPKIIESYFKQSPPKPIPGYEVFLAGDRYSTKTKYASLSSLSLETTRDDILMSIIKGNTIYMRAHLEQIKQRVALSSTIHVTGGGVSPAFIQCKKQWMGNYNYAYCQNSSMLGAAQLAHYHLTGEEIWSQ